ncbi:MAG: hypothetical protein LBF24_02805 [Puniceicoccales bacterium]|jgi:hypothetical protein|nr:hypothetical protein [Puniceicoccales bacterium]
MMPNCVAQSVAASAMGKYFCEPGMPKSYADATPFVFDGELAIFMQQTTGMQLQHTWLARTKGIERSGPEKIIGSVRSEAKEGRNYLAIAKNSTNQRQIYAPQIFGRPSWPTLSELF